MKKELVKKVNVYLANLGVEYVKLHNLHWNVVVINFKAIHEYLEELYDGITASLDSVAELLKMHGEVPAASLKEYLELSEIRELDSLEVSGKEALQIVLDDFRVMQKLALEIRKDADNEELYDFVGHFEGDLAQYGKAIWFISAMMK